MKNENNHHINLLTDFGFKRFFGTEPYKNNLLHFLNTFIGPYIGSITDITYRPTEQLGFQPTEKRAVLDVLCTTQGGDQVIVEMQKTSQEFLKDRIVAYSSRLISNSLKVGDRKYNFPPVISVLLADFSIPELKDREDYMQHVTLKDEQNNIFSDKMSFLLIDLSKFAAQKQFDQLADDRARWCYSIQNMSRMGEGEIPKRFGIFHKLYEDCRLIKLSTMEKQEYEKSVLEYEDVKDAMDYHHRLGIDEGFQKGLEKGLEKGREEGVEKGRAEGRKEALLEAARKFLELGVSISDVAKATGLSEEQVRALKG
jgi:predicted transposase/invertase (TIGR01784 family)